MGTTNNTRQWANNILGHLHDWKMVSILKKEDFIGISCKVIHFEVFTDPFERINLQGRRSLVHTHICTLLYCALVEVRHLEIFIATQIRVLLISQLDEDCFVSNLKLEINTVLDLYEGIQNVRVCTDNSFHINIKLYRILRWLQAQRRLAGLYKTTVIKADPPCTKRSKTESKISQTPLNWRTVRKLGPRNGIWESWPKRVYYAQISLCYKNLHIFLVFERREASIDDFSALGFHSRLYVVRFVLSSQHSDMYKWPSLANPSQTWERLLSS